MNKHIVKICGIRDPDMAMKASYAGADLIGIVMHPASPRYVTLEEAILISRAVKQSGCIPVAVFVDHTDVEMQQICLATDIKMVQLHGVISRAHHHLLPKAYQKIYVQTISEYGEMNVDDQIQSLDPARDMILIDNDHPGSGQLFPRTQFKYRHHLPWLLAGGLTPHNVAEMIETMQPQGVCVSSGVEMSKGKKDLLLIQQFVQSVRGIHETTRNSVN